LQPFGLTFNETETEKRRKKSVVFPVWAVESFRTRDLGKKASVSQEALLYLWWTWTCSRLVKTQS